MIIPFGELKYYPFCVSGVDVFLQRPLYSKLLVNGRMYNGFICIKSGKCRYIGKSGSFTMGDRAVAYLPLNSVHTLEILSDTIEFYRVDFSVTVNGEKVFFSDSPVKITDNAPQECFYALSYLAENFIGYENTVEKTEKICTIFRTLQQSVGLADSKRIKPALDYISNDPTRPINCGRLAELCFLGTSQFYTLFKKETKTTPLEYRNTLLMRKAVMLLENTDSSINEIAVSLGFQSVHYFSRFFKKHAGCSPKKYKNDSRAY